MADRCWIVGSLPDCDLRVESATVSGRHCRLTQQEDGFLLEDLGSSNGTYVDGQRLRESLLVQRGDAVTLGRLILMPWPSPSLNMTIGRLPDNDFVVPHDCVSGHHARIECEREQFCLVDLHSTNGTAINDPLNKISRVSLQHSDKVFLGTHLVPAADLLAAMPVRGVRESTVLEDSPATTSATGLSFLESPELPATAACELRRRRSPSGVMHMIAVALGGVTAIGLYNTPPFQHMLRSLQSHVHQAPSSGDARRNDAGNPAAPLPAVQPIEAIVGRIESSTTQLVVTHHDGRVSLGSGFIAERLGYCVTNYHVIQGAKSIRVKQGDGQPVEVLGVLLAAPAKDVAVLMTDSAAAPLQLHRASPRKGEAVLALGSPGGHAFSATDGIVSAIRQGSLALLPRHDPNLVWIQHSAEILQGSSGGPLVNRHGEVVGMNTWIDKQGTSLNFALSAREIANLIYVIQEGAMQSFADLPNVDLAPGSEH